MTLVRDNGDHVGPDSPSRRQKWLHRLDQEIGSEGASRNRRPANKSGAFLQFCFFPARYGHSGHVSSTATFARSTRTRLNIHRQPGRRGVVGRMEPGILPRKQGAGRRRQRSQSRESQALAGLSADPQPGPDCEAKDQRRMQLMVSRKLQSRQAAPASPCLGFVHRRLGASAPYRPT